MQVMGIASIFIGLCTPVCSMLQGVGKANQTIISGTYGDLTIETAGTATATGDITATATTINSGVTLDAGHIWRALIDVVYTMLLAAVFPFPVRAWLGIYRQNRLNKEKEYR